MKTGRVIEPPRYGLKRFSCRKPRLPEIPALVLVTSGWLVILYTGIINVPCMAWPQKDSHFVRIPNR